MLDLSSSASATLVRCKWHSKASPFATPSSTPPWLEVAELGIPLCHCPLFHCSLCHCALCHCPVAKVSLFYCPTTQFLKRDLAWAHLFSPSSRFRCRCLVFCFAITCMQVHQLQFLLWRSGRPPSTSTSGSTTPSWRPTTPSSRLL